MTHLDRVDLGLALSKREEAKRLAAAGERLVHLRLALAGLLDGGAPGPPLLIIFEGWDASGKGGAIKRLAEPLDPRHVDVHQFAAPTENERSHHFLWRFSPHLPGWGEMSIFDRSWYGRVLVERVEGLATREEWTRAYDEIVAFERLLAAEGTTVVKLWMHISDREQLRRFEKRRDDPLKSWKLTEEDWRNRDRRPEYEAAVEEMVDRTDHEDGPWTLVAGESKPHARVFVVEHVIGRIEAALRRHGRDVPAPLSG